MKVAVTSTLPTIDACVGTGLRRSKYLLIIDIDTMKYEAMPNPILSIGGPAAGKLFAQQLLQKDVTKILTNSCSPDIRKTLGLAGIQVIDGTSGSVYGAVEQLREKCMADTVIMSIEEIEE